MNEAQAVSVVNYEERAAPPYWTYPAGWSMDADMRVGKLKECFPKLDFSHVQKLARRYHQISLDDWESSEPRLNLPEGMDGLAIIPKIESLARLVQNPAKSWKPVNIALQHLLGVLKEVYGKGFHDWTGGRIGPEFHRLLAHTEYALDQDGANTPGDVHVLAVQTGQLFVGYSMDAVRVQIRERPRHLGLHCVGGGSLMLAYPERFVEGALWMDCPGSGRVLHGDGQFRDAPICISSDGRRDFSDRRTDNHAPCCGSGSFVLPELL